MTEKEKLQHLINHNSFLAINHIELTDVGTDWAIMELKAQEDSLNPMGLVHGGALFTMADSAGGAAARTDGRNYVTLSSSFTFLRSGLPGDLIQAKGRVRRRGKTTCYTDVDITNQKGDLLANGSFIYFHVPEPDLPV